MGKRRSLLSEPAHGTLYWHRYAERSTDMAACGTKAYAECSTMVVQCAVLRWAMWLPGSMG
eukprot:354393-Rhodomonas_salina.1